MCENNDHVFGRGLVGQKLEQNIMDCFSAFSFFDHFSVSAKFGLSKQHFGRNVTRISVSKLLDQPQKRIGIFLP